MPNMAKAGVYLAFILLLSPQARADDCDAYLAAMVKYDHTPFRRETTPGDQAGPGHFRFKATKTIFTGDALYEWTDGAWKEKPTTGDTLEENFHKHQRDYTTECRSGGAETVDGDDTDIVVLHEKSINAAPDTFVVDERYWISRKSGLPVKSEETLTVESSSHDPATLKSATTYRYDDVQAPPQ
jgi:hypothetical protein